MERESNFNLEIEEKNLSTFESIVEFINDISKKINNQNKSDEEIFNVYQEVMNESSKLREVLDSILKKQSHDKKTLLNMGFTEYAESMIEAYAIIYDDRIIEEDNYEQPEFTTTSKGYDSLAIYLREMAKIPLLTTEQEKELTIKYYETKDPKIRKKIIEHNLRLVISISKKYIGRGLSLQDLIQEGNIGLMKTVEKYDPNLNCRFSTYAIWWIKQSLDRAVKEKGRTIRIPVHVHEQLSEYVKAKNELEKTLRKKPSYSEMVKYTQYPEDKIKLYEKLLCDTASLNTPAISDERDSDEIGDFIEDTDDIGPAAKAIEKIQNKETMQLLECLTIREKQIICLRFGLAGLERPRTLEETANYFGVTRERIRQIEARALRKLRVYDKGKNKRRNDNIKSIKHYFFQDNLTTSEIKKIALRLSLEEIKILKEFYCGDIADPKMTNPNVNAETVKKILDTSVAREVEIIKKEREKLEVNSDLIYIPSNLYCTMRKLGFSTKQIDIAASRLSKEDTKLLKQYDGRNSSDDLTRLSTTTENTKTINKIIEGKLLEILNSFNYNIYTYLKKEKVSPKNLQKAFIMLDKEELQFLYKYYGDSFENEDATFESKEDYEYTYNVLFPKIKELLKLNLVSTKEYKKAIDEFFTKLECDETKIHQIYTRMDKIKKSTITNYYSMNEKYRNLPNNRVVSALLSFMMEWLAENSEIKNNQKLLHN